MILPNGVQEVQRSDYDRLADRANWSTLKFMGRSTAHYHHRLIAPNEGDTSAK